MRHHGIVAGLDRVLHARERHGAQVAAELGHDQDVARPELAPLLLHRAAREQVGQLRRDVEHGAQRLAVQQRRRDRRRSRRRRPYSARPRPANSSRCRRRRASGRRSRSATTPPESTCWRAVHARGCRSPARRRPPSRDRSRPLGTAPRGDRSPAPPTRARLARQHHVDDLALNEADRQLELAAIEARLLIDQIQIVVALAVIRLQLARRDVQERRFPLEALDQLLHLRDRHAGDVEAAHDRADAGAGDFVDRHAQLRQRLQDADVRAAACAAAREREPYRRPAVRGMRRRIVGRGGLRRRVRRRQRRGEQQRERRAAAQAAPASGRVAKSGRTACARRRSAVSRGAHHTVARAPRSAVRGPHECGAPAATTKWVWGALTRIARTFVIAS